MLFRSPTLFFSPLLGALTGWFGVLLVAALKSLDLLGNVFRDIAWDNPMAPMTLATALLMGISERMFDGLILAAEEKAGVKPVERTAEQTAQEREAHGRARTIAAPPPGAPIFIQKLEPSTSAVGGKIRVTGIVLTPDSVRALTGDDVKHVFLVGADAKATEVATEDAGQSHDLIFTLPTDLRSGDYYLRLVDASGASKEQRNATLTVPASKVAAAK